MMAAPHSLTGRLILPGPLPAAQALVRVALMDATYADSLSRIVSSTTFIATRDASNPLEFRLQTEQPRAGERWIFDVVVTADLSGKVAPGDYVIAESVGYVGPGAPDDQPVSLNLEMVT